MPGEIDWKLYPDGRLARFSALPVLTDFNVRSAPVLEIHAIHLVGTSFEPISALAPQGISSPPARHVCAAGRCP
ncbi:hypothetical protein EB235_18315 [Mesorhizobium loti R88b]|uniref:Uncharacterized protein n=1 Tax=Mesorhizobium loti R88b TaxID=935548 RepID=A0A6M7WMS4_RHILI|nr:hypothetical protein EB235_18315 [Mesorhizobium loti R88b]